VNNGKLYKHAMKPASTISRSPNNEAFAAQSGQGLATNTLLEVLSWQRLGASAIELTNANTTVYTVVFTIVHISGRLQPIPCNSAPTRGPELDDKSPTSDVCV
jgi:hypothetical protein